MCCWPSDIDIEAALNVDEGDNVVVWEDEEGIDKLGFERLANDPIFGKPL